MTALSEELRHTQAEKDRLLSQSAATQTTEELEELRGRLAALTEEREELLHAAERLRGEKEELRAQLEEKTHMVKTLGSSPTATNVIYVWNNPSFD